MESPPRTTESLKNHEASWRFKECLKRFELKLISVWPQPVDEYSWWFVTTEGFAIEQLTSRSNFRCNLHFVAECFDRKATGKSQKAEAKPKQWCSYGIVMSM